MIRLLAALACLSALAGCGDGAPVAANQAAAAPKAEAPRAPAPLGDVVRVRIDTEMGPIVVALDHKRAPLTSENFVRYAEEGRFDGTTFYRAAKTPRSEGRGFIQGGIRRDYRRMLPPIAHEPTSATGLRHREGTISMARAEEGAGAIGDFFITASAMPAMDAHGDSPGYAAFGQVVEGMDIVRRILAAPTLSNAGRGAMRGQWLASPVRIVRARPVE